VTVPPSGRTPHGRRVGASLTWTNRAPGECVLECHSMLLPASRDSLRWGQPAYIPVATLEGSTDELDALIRALTWVRENC